MFFKSNETQEKLETGSEVQSEVWSLKFEKFEVESEVPTAKTVTLSSSADKHAVQNLTVFPSIHVSIWSKLGTFDQMCNGVSYKNARMHQAAIYNSRYLDV